MSLHFERLGTGRPLLMVHGLGANLRTWDPILDTLRGSRELILVDLPGHGSSAPLAGRQTVEAHADALANFVQSQGLSTADLAGSSVGGRLVLELARRGVGRHCVALDPGGFWRGLETRWFHWTLAASIRLVRLLRPLHTGLARHAFTRTLLLAQLSARPWLLSPQLVAGELQSLAATPVFDAMLFELAHGAAPGRLTSDSRSGHHRLGPPRSPVAAPPGRTRPDSLPVGPAALVRALRALSALGPARRDGATDP